MARINLLPWRQKERERRNKEFITLAIVVTLLALLAAFASWSYFNDALESQRDANTLLEQENTRLDTALVEIKGLEQRREDIISRMQVIQDLQGLRPMPVRLWDDLTKAIPATLYPNNLKRQGDTLILTGRADNPYIVSRLMLNLDKSKWMNESAVSNIQQDINAYQSTPTSNNKATTDAQSRSTHPEDSYVKFMVTTKIQLERAISDDADTALGEGL